MRPVIKKILLGVVIGAPALLLGGLLLIYLSLPDVVDLMTNNPRTSALMVQRFREAKNSRQDLVIRQQWVSFDEIPELLRDTIRVTEDAAFYPAPGGGFRGTKSGLQEKLATRQIRARSQYHYPTVGQKSIPVHG